MPSDNGRNLNCCRASLASFLGNLEVLANPIKTKIKGRTHDSHFLLRSFGNHFAGNTIVNSHVIRNIFECASEFNDQARESALGYRRPDGLLMQ